MCTTIRRQLINKRSKETQIKLHEAMAVPTLTDPKYGLQGKKPVAKIETAEMKFMRSVAGYRRKDKITNIKLGQSCTSSI
jgi:hypothetical protein